MLVGVLREDGGVETGGAVLNAAADAAVGALVFDSDESAAAFRACALLQLENCIVDGHAPTARGGVQIRDVLLLVGGAAVGVMVGKSL